MGSWNTHNVRKIWSSSSPHLSVPKKAVATITHSLFSRIQLLGWRHGDSRQSKILCCPDSWLCCLWSDQAQCSERKWKVAIAWSFFACTKYQKDQFWIFLSKPIPAKRWILDAWVACNKRYLAKEEICLAKLIFESSKVLIPAVAKLSSYKASGICWVLCMT